MASVECIYCNRVAGGQRFARPDHVMPKAFGSFRHNFTVFCVCEECNQWFGDHLENTFGRNSGEALLRLLFGAKPLSEAHEVGGHRIEFRLDDDSDMRGAYVVVRATDDDRLLAQFVPQIGFCEADGSITWVREIDLSADDVNRFAAVDTMTVGFDESDYQRLAMRLAELGWSNPDTLWVHPDSTLPLIEAPVKVNYQIDAESLRTVCKIAFNYLAHRVGPDFCLASEFDSFRRFVRYGEGESGSFIRVALDPLLLEERRGRAKQTRGHLLAIDWHPRQPAPTGSVKLFNDIHYRVAFAQHMSILWREIRSGHHFSVADHTILPLSTARWPPF